MMTDEWGSENKGTCICRPCHKGSDLPPHDKSADYQSPKTQFFPHPQHSLHNPSILSGGWNWDATKHNTKTTSSPPFNPPPIRARTLPPTSPPLKTTKILLYPLLETPVPKFPAPNKNLRYGSSCNDILRPRGLPRRLLHGPNAPLRKLSSQTPRPKSRRNSRQIPQIRASSPLPL